MNKTKLGQIEEVSKKYQGDIPSLVLELKKVQSQKCRLKKSKGKKTYEQEMLNILAYEQVLKEVRNLLEPKEKNVTNFELDDVKKLDYNETLKAIKSIQTKKCLSKWLTTVENDNDEYRSAVIIEEMLLDHKKSLSPVEQDKTTKRDVQTIIETIESSGDLSKEAILELLKKLV